MPLQKLPEGRYTLLVTMIRGLRHREQGAGDRGQSSGHDPRAGALRAFERYQYVLERPGGQRARAPI